MVCVCVGGMNINNTTNNNNNNRYKLNCCIAPIIRIVTVDLEIIEVCRLCMRDKNSPQIWKLKIVRLFFCSTIKIFKCLRKT